MNVAELVAFLRKQPWAVEATVNGANEPQAAVIGVVVTDRAELFFDTSRTSRKYGNLRARPAMAFVIGWDDGCTAQYEGLADEPTGEELTALKALYFERFPDGREREQWPDIAYVRVRPRWVRFSDFRGSAPRIVEVALPGGGGAS
jgi:uncharacterized pyridoxamine 5'-phosphate oxidase family protein